MLSILPAVSRSITLEIDLGPRLEPVLINVNVTRKDGLDLPRNGTSDEFVFRIIERQRSHFSGFANDLREVFVLGPFGGEDLNAVEERRDNEPRTRQGKED